MKILHTADWHLGKKLHQFERTDEHQDFLNWLIGKLQSECIDVLIVAGDVFDTGTPSNTALQQYYRFLRQVKDTCCREVIVIGGNHDSISTLNAPRELLRYFNVHIVGGVPEDFSQQVIPIRDAAGNVQLVVCAVPFLRDRDIRLSVTGETSSERVIRIREGIRDHYHRLVSHIAEYKATGIPVIATGHLFAAGAETSESEKEIHVGNLGHVPGDAFPAEFDYVALGHIHRPQVVNKLQHIRYSGSPIPLSFSETDDRKQVVILEFAGGKLTAMGALEVPCCRKLIRIRGNLDRVKEQVRQLQDHQVKYPAWVEVQVETDAFIPDLDDQLHQLKTTRPFIEHFFPRQLRTRPVQGLHSLTTEEATLHDLDPKAVFLKKCLAEFGDADCSELVQTFEEVLEQMQQKDPGA